MQTSIPSKTTKALSKAAPKDNKLITQKETKPVQKPTSTTAPAKKATTTTTKTVKKPEIVPNKVDIPESEEFSKPTELRFEVTF